MVEPRDWCESFGDVESMIRAAGDYVQPSRDLRPRVLEAARVERGERQARRSIGRVALLAAMLGALTITGMERWQTPDAFHHLTLVAAAARTYASTEVSASGGESGWALVEAYTELRRRQAEVLRL
jgi:hypothetical protein